MHHVRVTNRGKQNDTHDVSEAKPRQVPREATASSFLSSVSIDSCHRRFKLKAASCLWRKAKALATSLPANGQLCSAKVDEVIIKTAPLFRFTVLARQQDTFAKTIVCFRIPSVFSAAPQVLHRTFVDPKRAPNKSQQQQRMQLALVPAYSPVGLHASLPLTCTVRTALRGG